MGLFSTYFFSVFLLILELNDTLISLFFPSGMTSISEMRLECLSSLYPSKLYLSPFISLHRQRTSDNDVLGAYFPSSFLATTVRLSLYASYICLDDDFFIPFSLKIILCDHRYCMTMDSFVSKCALFFLDCRCSGAFFEETFVFSTWLT